MCDIFGRPLTDTSKAIFGFRTILGNERLACISSWNSAGGLVHPRAPYEFIDMSVKEAYDSGWKDKVRTRIRRSDSVIVLVNKNSTNSTGQKWEIACAKEEGKKVRGIRAYSNDRTEIQGATT